MLTVTQSGSFDKTERFLYAMQKTEYILQVLQHYGAVGVQALSSATPIESGRAAASWSYKVTKKGSTYSLDWFNSDVENGYSVVIGLQYGHGTGTGGFVQGRDFINPAIRPIFDEIESEVWKAVTSA
jgi:hypothetical protein